LTIWKAKELDERSPDRETLIAYFLRELSEERRSEIAGRYFEDDDFFFELLDVENELIEKYVRGSLNKREHEGFKHYLARLPDGRLKEATAGALLQFADAEKAKSQQILNEFARSRFSLWEKLRNSLPKRRPMLQYIAAASLVALAIALLLSFSKIKRLRNHNDQLRAEIASLEREKESHERNAENSQSESKRVRQVEEQLKLEQQANEAQAQRLATLQPTTPVIASWTLTAAFRSATAPDEVTLPRSARFVSVTIPIDGEEQIQIYRAIIQTTTGEDLREQKGLRANKAGNSVTLKLPSDYFKETSYKLTLVGKDKDAVELARDYYFTVRRR
jgi:hypothetical protein